MPKRALFTLAPHLFFSLSLQYDAILLSTVATAQNRIIPAPEDVLGFRPGDDRKLASWTQVVTYFQRLSAASDRVKVEEIGKSTMGRPFVYATISAPENLNQRQVDRQPSRFVAIFLGLTSKRIADILSASGRSSLDISKE